MMPLIDRAREVAELRRLATSGQKQLAVLYGRRQVGKTYLLSHAWPPGARVFYFLAAALTPDLNRADLLRELSAWSRQGLDLADYPTWRTVFRAILSLAESGPVVVVLDEFQYLLTGGGDVTSQLVAVWDAAPRDLPITLVLSGSEVSTMAHLHSGGEPLYGRVTWAAQLQPFDYRDAARMAPWLSARDAPCLYGVFGGTPRYLAALQPGETLAEAAARTIISLHGEVHLQMLTLIEQEKGIRQPTEYRAVLNAVAGGRTALNQIATLAGLEEHVVRRALGVLGDLGLVTAQRNFEAGTRAPFRYFIADPALAFWHRFVVPHRSRLQVEEPLRFWQSWVAPGLDTYMGAPFESLVEQAYERYHPHWKLPAARAWSRWEGAGRGRESIQVDLVARLEDGRLLAGEVRWSTAAQGSRLHTALMHKLALLAASGLAWAQDMEDALFLYVSAGGFSRDLRALARADRRIRLLALPDLYPPD